ncbi:MAG: membrane protein insertase YidC [Hyphomonadaceae bacterium]|nr:membrane protein insertase YidC [Hyphomonadaceae bacterium]
MEKEDQRNFLLALVLCFGLFMAYNMLVLEPQQRQQREAKARGGQTEQVTNSPAQQNKPKARDEIVPAELAAARRVTIDAPAVDGTISLVGGRIDDVSLKGFYETIEAKQKNDKSAEVQLLSPAGSDRAFYAVVAWSSGGSSTEDALWTQTSTGPLTPANPLTMTFTSASARIDRTVTIDDFYMFTVTDTLTNTGAAPITLTPSVRLHQLALTEHLKPPPQAHAGVIGTYNTTSNQMVSYADLNKGKGVIQDVTAGWIALTTKYWMASAVPPQGETVQMTAGVTRSNGQSFFNAGYAGTPYTVEPGKSVSKAAHIFAGAKRVSVLDNYEKQQKIPAFTDAVDWSWLFFITKPFFFLLQLFQNWFGSFGLAILALTVVVKIVFFPLQYSSFKSMSRLRKFQPEMQALQERFAADPARLRQEQAALWKREKVNPISGCLPLLPTFFVFYALYHTLMVTLEMRHAPFLGTWIQDMSAPDPLSLFNLFGLIPWNPASVPLVGGFLMIGPWALLYGVTMVALQGLSAPPTDPMQKAIMRWIPLVFTILFAGFAVGLVIYYVWSNFITVIQQYIIMRRTGVDTEIDKFIAKRFGKKPPPDDGGKSERAPAK